MTYLLDTNTCVAHLRGKSPRITQKVYSYLPNEVVVCSTVKGELVYGALHGTRPEENLRILEQFFEVVESVPFDDAAAYQYAEFGRNLRLWGRPLARMTS